MLTHSLCEMAMVNSMHLQRLQLTTLINYTGIHLITMVNYGLSGKSVHSNETHHYKIIKINRNAVSAALFSRVLIVCHSLFLRDLYFDDSRMSETEVEVYYDNGRITSSSLTCITSS